jgi:hypothetical protein
MARTLTTVFNPFTYEEINAPLLQATQAHQALEEQYSVLADKAAEMEQLRYNAQDADVYREYQNYMNNLQKSVNDLAANGLNVGSRNAFIGLKNQYQKTINPMEKALAERTRQAQLQQQAALNDPDRMFARSANNIGLREYMSNPNLDALSQNYSGTTLTKNVQEQIAGLAKDMATLNRVGNVDSYNYKMLLKRGFNAGDIQNFINTYGTGNYQPSNKNNAILQTIVESTIDSSGMKSWENWEALKDKAYAYANRGLWSGIGESTMSTLENKAALADLQVDTAYRTAKAQIKAQKETAAEDAEDADNLDNISLATHSFETDSEGAAEARKGLAALESVSGVNKQGERVGRVDYFGKTGNVNPLQVKEEVDNEVARRMRENVANSIAKSNPAAAAEIKRLSQSSNFMDRERAKMMTNVQLSTNPMAKSSKASETFIRQQVENEFKQKYGVKKILNTEQAKALKDSNYTGGYKLAEVYDNFNMSMEQYNWKSFNFDVGAYEHIGNTLANTLNLDNVKDRKDLVYELKPDGSKGKGVKPSSLKLGNTADMGTGEDKKKKITDVGVSPKYPNHLIVNTGDGKLYIVPNYFLSAEYENFVKTAVGDGFMDNNTFDGAAYNAFVRGAAKYVNDFNQGMSKSSSKAPGAE